MKRILCLRHGNGPDDDRVANFCKLNDMRADIRRPFKGELCGDITDDLAGVVVYGGMYNAYDTKLHPFLNEEYRIMEAAIAANVPVLGICQGAQMIAHLHGAFAGAPGHGKYEFGYYEVSPTEAGQAFMQTPLHLCQWHFHTFDIPTDGVHLARSDLFENQAFRIGDAVYGFQFHPENTIEGFRRWQARATQADHTNPGAQSKITQTELMHAHDASQATWFYDFLGQLFERSLA